MTEELHSSEPPAATTTTPWRPALSASQRQIRDWMAAVAPDLADAYEGAVTVVQSLQSLPGSMRFVAHAARDIANGLPEALSHVKEGPLRYEVEVERLAAEWSNSGCDSPVFQTPTAPALQPIPSTPDVPLPRRVVTSLGDLINRHRATRKKPGDAARRLYAALDPSLRDDPGLQPTLKLWLRVRDFFVERAHFPRKPHRSPIDIDTFRREFELFEHCLLVFAQPFLKTTDRIDALLDEATSRPWTEPTPATVNRALALLAHAQQRAYFFSRLDNPLWMDPLRKRGCFTIPPSVISDPTAQTIAFPPWPESRYLVRMATVPEAQSRILSAALAIPDTDNILVREDLVDIAVTLPAPLAAELVPQLVRWARNARRILWGIKLGHLIGHLARAGEAVAALTLARAALQVVPDAHDVAEEIRELTTPEPGSVIDTYAYGEILRKQGRDLLAATGLEGLRLLCDLLHTAVRLSRRAGDEPPEDYSEIRRPAIEQDGHRDTVMDLLISAARDATAQLVASDASMLHACVDELERHDWLIFQRLALHLLRQSTDLGQQLVTTRLEEAGHLNRFTREYALLARERFGSLEHEAQARILAQIEGGPDLELYKLRHQRWSGALPTDEEAERAKRKWQRDRLNPLRDNLPIIWVERLAALKTEFGEPRDPATPRMTVTRVGPTSPKEQTEVAAMSVEEIVGFLASWRPSGGSTAPSPKGLSRMLVPVIAHDPERFAASADAFIGIDPIYVRSALEGWRDAAKEKRSFPWAPVLNLVRWVLDRPAEGVRPADAPDDADPGWQWSRTAAARLLDTGLADDVTEMPIAVRESVWQCLKPLMEDSDPTPESEAKYGGTNMDPATLSINTTRGNALHAAMQYGLWVRRHLEREPDSHERLTKGFGEMPELREAFDRHLDPRVDPSAAVRSVYGQWFPWLHLLDAGWTADAIDRIFPPSVSDMERWRAAWRAYVVYCDPYDRIFELLRGVYARAIDDIGTSPDAQLHLHPPDERLADHLMILHQRAVLDPNETNGLLPAFFQKAGDALRAHAISFVGRGLTDWDGAPPAGLLGRLMKLWTLRLSAAQSAADRTAFKEEIAAFGWWFASGKFEDSWALDNLARVFEIAGKAEPDHHVAERLAATVLRYPRESVECLSRLVEADRGGWGILGWKDSARAILKTALGSDNGDARTEAEALVNRLGQRGHLDLRDLTKPADT